MEPCVVVVPKIALKGLAQFRRGRKRSTVRQFRLERVEERFHVGVLVGRPASRHALLYAARVQACAKGRAEKFTAAIAVEDQPATGLAAPKGGVHDRSRADRVADRGEPPGQHTPGVLIQDDGQVPPPARDGQVGEIANLPLPLA
mgnify:CR=1 FL=1